MNQAFLVLQVGRFHLYVFVVVPASNNWVWELATLAAVLLKVFCVFWGSLSVIAGQALSNACTLESLFNIFNNWTS